jgi:hypothetical protein
MILFFGCSEEKKEKNFDVDVNNIGVNFQMIDISKDFYNYNLSIADFKKKYPFFLDADISEAQYNKQRSDTLEVNIYKQIQQKVDNNKIKTDLTDLFRHIKYYYPDFKEPAVFLYSSFCQDYLNPVTYVPEKNYLFIATDCFLGDRNRYYDIMRIDYYLQKTMSQPYLSSKTAREIAKTFVSKNLQSQNFLSLMIYEGKILTLIDAFLPNIPDEYKIGYTQPQIDWAKENEFQVWQYFVQNNYVFSDNTALGERFLSIAPFSKFYNNIDQQSPGQIGCWIGWQICLKYLLQNSETKLQDMIKNPNAEEIFAQSKYKPKETDNEKDSSQIDSKNDNPTIEKNTQKEKNETVGN